MTSVTVAVAHFRRAMCQLMALEVTFLYEIGVLFTDSLILVCAICTISTSGKLVICHTQCSNYMEVRVCRAPHLFLLPHRANAVVKYLGGEGPTYFSVI